MNTIDYAYRFDPSNPSNRPLESVEKELVAGAGVSTRTAGTATPASNGGP